MAVNESDVIKHLCNCDDVNLGWCFIHQKARSIEPYTQGTEFGFIPPNVIDIPLFRPPRILDIDNLDQWAFAAHTLVKVMQSKNVCVFNCIDDIICVHEHQNAHQEFDTLFSLFEFPGLPIHPKKVVPPTSALICMGIKVDVASGMVIIPHDKCLQILNMCRHFTTKKQVTRKQLQSLLGKLIYLHRCVPASRIFVNRLLNMLCQCPHRVTISEDMKKDLSWFIQFWLNSMEKYCFQPCVRNSTSMSTPRYLAWVPSGMVMHVLSRAILQP